MVDAFASANTDLAKRLKVAAFSGEALEQIDLLLQDASAHLRSVIGWQVYPAADVTHTVWDCVQGDLDLPGSPISAVTAVTVDDVTLDPSGYRLQGGQLRRLSGTYQRIWTGVVEVTYTVGYATPPPDLVAWTCVLASQALASVKDLGSLGPGEVSSLQLGPDYRIGWTQGDGSGFSLPDRVEERLRRTYGLGGAYVTGAR